jgi:phosphoribosylanthranilate isomerase
MLVKVCGLNTRDNIMAISKMEVDLMGFIFYKDSPRFFNNSLSFDEVREIPKRIKKVGVFVNETSYNVLNAIAHYNLDYVQLHGNESPDYCKELLRFVKVIKTISIKDQNSILEIKNYTNLCNYLLFDTSSPTYGGTGQSFNWQFLKDVEINTPFFISGGISLENVSEIKGLPYKNLIGIDVNSKFEIKPGLKDLNKIQQLIKEINYANSNN